ncbi:DUF4175 family protein [Microvirga sp. W0021]|uniref:DUF4175 family protein n=1 Tax=Hohaiivirga grylli TaxID=3133970 RepID=A0ABV0BNG6_9HYPH
MPEEQDKQYAKSIARLNRLAGLAWLAIGIERLWQNLWPPVGVALIFLGFSWIGGWQILPGWAHVILLGIFAAGFLYSCKSLLKLRSPTLNDALQRVDRDSQLPHGQAESMNDLLAVGRGSALTRTLWLMHRKQASQTIPDMRVAFPNPEMPTHDRYALRSVAILLAIAGAFVAGPDKLDRLTDAFKPALKSSSDETQGLQVTGWITPPAYTGIAPITLDFSTTNQVLRVPVNSRLILKASSETSAKLSIVPLPAQQQGKTDNQLAEYDTLLTEKTDVTLKTGWFNQLTQQIELIPDTPPSIELDNKMDVNRRGTFGISFRGYDDYGITDAKALFTLNPQYRSLVPAPEITINLPAGYKDGKTLNQTLNLGDHPWAGLPVTMRLAVSDGAGQKAQSQAYQLTLPQRPFTVPLAIKLAEIRRILVVESDRKREAIKAIRDLLTITADAPLTSAQFLGLRHAYYLTRSLTTDQDQLELAAMLWDMAIQIEDAMFSDAEKQLRSAQDKLQEAISRGASPAEIERLSQELRDAMGKYLQELTARAAQSGDQQQITTPMGQPMGTDQLSQLIDQFENLMQQGKVEEAQKVLEQIRNIFDNLQISKTNPEMDARTAAAIQAMSSAKNLLQTQQTLNDDTYDHIRKQLMYPDEKPASDTKFNELQKRQGSLKQQLQSLGKEAQEAGIETDDNLKEAREAMQQAEDALGSQDSELAIDAQTRALEALKRGAENMMQQAQSMMQNNMLLMPQGGQQGNNPNPFQGKANIKDTRQHLREVIEQLRNKLSDPTRPKDELDYFERLLRD